MAALVLSALTIEIASADDDDDPRPAAGIKDNSFLIDEAYNQGPGEIQHIVTLQRQFRDWNLAFTQEHSLGTQAHQLTTRFPTCAFAAMANAPSGIGDVEVNYRYQAWMETANSRRRSRQA